MSFARLAAAPLTLALALVLAGGSTAAREPGVALVMDVAGDVEPPVAAFDELPAGTRLSLAPDAEITVLSYADCAERRLRGGAFVAAAEGLRVGRDAEVLAETIQPCPALVSLGGDSRMGALVLRGPEATATLAPSPRVVLLGEARGRWTAIRVESPGREPFDLPVTGGVAVAPGDLQPLPVGATATLTALGPDGARGPSLAAAVVAGAGMTLLAP